MSNRTVLKTFFETNDVPTESEFADLIDSNFNFSEDTTDEISEGLTNKFAPTTATETEAETGNTQNLRSFSPILIKKAVEALESIRVRIAATLVTSGFTCGNRIYLLNTSGAGFNVAPPASPTAGDQFGLIDATGGTSSTKYPYIRFSSAGVKFHGQSLNLKVQKTNFSVLFEYVDAATGWVVIRGSYS